MLFPPASPLSPLAFTGVVGAVQGIALLSILSVIIQEITNKRKQRTCQEPPSNIGSFVLIGKQGDAAFFDCPGTAFARHDFTQTCPIIYCQDNGNYSAPAFEAAPSMCISEIINKRKQRTCQEPPSNIGNFVFIGKQGDAAFSDCPGTGFVRHDFNQTCPIIYCQDNGNYSAPAFEVAPSMCASPDVRYEIIQSTSGEITSPNYPSNYNPSSTSTVTVWNIMVPGKNLKFKIEDLDIDTTSDVDLLCGYGVTSWFKENEATVIGLDFTCNKPCALIILYQFTGPGGRGFNISITSDE